MWRRKKLETNSAICEILTKNVNSLFDDFFHSLAILAALGTSTRQLFGPTFTRTELRSNFTDFMNFLF